jgi:hypothetical protein
MIDDWRNGSLIINQQSEILNLKEPYGLLHGGESLADKDQSPVGRQLFGHPKRDPVRNPFFLA